MIWLRSCQSEAVAGGGLTGLLETREGFDCGSRRQRFGHDQGNARQGACHGPIPRAIVYRHDSMAGKDRGA